MYFSQNGEKMGIIFHFTFTRLPCRFVTFYLTHHNVPLYILDEEFQTLLPISTKMIFFVSTSRLYLYKQFFSFYWGSDSFQSLKCTYMLTHLISLTYSNLGALFFCVNKIFIHVTDGTFFFFVISFRRKCLT